MAELSRRLEIILHVMRKQRGDVRPPAASVAPRNLQTA
jgi:hypothetical protein